MTEVEGNGMRGETVEAALQRPLSEVKADLFRSLAHPARVRALEVLVEGPRTVGELQQEVGIESSHLSQQLAVLRRAGVVVNRREGSSVVYSVRGPEVAELLAAAKRLLIASLSDVSVLLEGLRTDATPR